MLSRGSPSRFRGRGGYSRGGASLRGLGRGGALEQSVPDVLLPLPTGPMLLKIEVADLVAPSQKAMTSSKITEVKYATSYNWLRRENPAIKVPGKPPAWTPLAQPLQLSEDSGTYFRDINAAHYPNYPMEPMVQALLAEQPDYPTTDVDIVACGSTLGNLLGFVRGNDKTFRFLLEAVGDTVFFVRMEKSPKETIPGVRGYGHSFPEAYTTWEDDVKGSESHQRVIQYRFGDLSLLVRFESDGYLRGQRAFADKEPPSEATASVARPPAAVDPDVLSGLLHSTTVTHRLPSSHNALEINNSEKTNIPQDSLFDLKTRSAKKKDVDTLAEELQRLWVSQTPNFILAYHESGRFTDVRVMNVRKKILQWERDNQEILRRLAALMQKLVEVARNRCGETIELRRTEVESLELWDHASQGSLVLPQNIEARWLGDKGSIIDPSAHDEDDLGDPIVRGVFEPVGDDSDYFDPDGDDYESEESEKDFTACSAEDCGYCGHCSY